MVVNQRRRVGRKPTGGRHTDYRRKRRYESGSKPSHTRVGEVDKKEKRTLGGHTKTKLAACNSVNLYDPKTKKYSKATIKAVVENAANRHFVRRNVMSKGALIDTDKGKAKITNRPGQEGAINAILV